jgi:hypothetical protein
VTVVVKVMGVQPSEVMDMDFDDLNWWLERAEEWTGWQTKATD